ncbi:MAG: flagellar hook-associated protein FlgL [Lautropia sp.]
MITRMSTATANERAIAAINERGARIATLQQQVSSGVKLQQASDDPLGAAQAERLRSREAAIAVERRMMGHASGMLRLAEGTIGGGIDVMQSARELLIQAGNGTLLPSDRQKIGEQLQAMRDQLFTIANTGDGTGGYVFGARGTASAPFAPASDPQFLPGDGTRATGTTMPFDTTVDGGALFLGDGTAREGGSIFVALDRAIAVLSDPSPDTRAIAENRTATLEMSGATLDATLARAETARAAVGSQLGAIESRDRLLESGEIDAQARRSAIVDTDYVAAISELQNASTANEAAMKTYAQISKMNLFDYL